MQNHYLRNGLQMILRRLPLAISILLAIALSATVYWQIKPLLAAKSSSNTLSKPSFVENTPSKAEHNIASFKLFGNSDVKKEVFAPTQQVLPVTKLRLTLTGVLVSPTASEASALVEGPDRTTLYYKIGDKLPGDATLEQVHDDRIVVERSGRLENLYFPKLANTGLAPAKNQLSNFVKPSASLNMPASARSVSPEAVQKARKQNVKNRLSKLRKRIVSDRK